MKLELESIKIGFEEEIKSINARIEERENDVRKLEEKLAKIKELIKTDKVFKRQCEEALENVEKEMEGR